ncbi:Peptidoglycan/LPS O-acetylase OafA/YrhL, contains acyltransferase and SGNH-hydrolase domains [Cognatiyoonia koreensis]|uniref:Peptidoglycan/LPS O-acetylase OafA/YrhL, contains acyltransferase and SGNH-hydrolase domains n=1 Tax=Cognatiyoonia koreensis TaxID=364200 RepID=A0A1I0RSZ6_9RHOB|nr:acyltransferase family protein [Cognatiyoonia koreensis]SEW44297.1 Peptidoglycan/LPS O-acetylase OafA/YrhL, contains acyltransferase and SGNH-hydrolase domains [Cognatiyoonia koreensis]
MKYRSEIDGLRAVAVVPVILFHAGLELFGGGFVGVDVFFVISGYLITTILIDELERGEFSILRFYERRARRILPALFFVMLCCLPFAWAWMLPNEIYSFGVSLMAVSVFISNIIFWRQEGYFAAAAEEKPLLHTWSLAVEEQYYVLFPIYLLLLWRFGRNPVFWSICVIATISLALSEWGWRNYPSANFYLAPTRAWELLAGSIAAFIISRHGVKSNNLLAAMGLAGIIYAIFAFDKFTPFPSLYALAPVGGTVLIILYSDRTTWVSKLLSTKGFVGIGLVSYSAYLWHQPLFAFARIRSYDQSGTPTLLGLGVVSLLLAWLSWRYIEQPFRKGSASVLPRRNQIFAASLVGILAFSGTGWFVRSQDGFPERLTAAQQDILKWESFDRDAAYRKGRCFMMPELDYTQFDDGCLGTGETVIWGDSYAAALTSGWRLNDPEVGQRTASACPPLLGVDMPERPNCKAINDATFAVIAELENPHVVLNGIWWGFDKYLDNLNATVQRLQEAGITNITIIGGTPQFSPTLPKRLISLDLALTQDHRIKADIGDVLAADDVLRTIAARHGVTFVPILPHICDNDGYCDAVITTDAGVFEPIAWDAGHLTPSGALHILRRIFPDT